MRTIRHSQPLHRDAGFSLIELLIVIILIVILSAVALPGILRFVRVQKVRGAAEQVAASIQTARGRAIMRNANVGAAFWVIDNNTYRFVLEDPPPDPLNQGPLMDLPTGVFFVAPAAGVVRTRAMRFDRMGRWCDPGPGARQCTPAAATVDCAPADRCDDDSGTAFIGTETDPAAGVAAGGALITMWDPLSGVRYQVGVTPGGRVRVKEIGETLTTAR